MKISEQSTNNFDCPTFIQFATSLPKSIDLSQFSKIDSDTISWVKQPRYDYSRMYIYIRLINEDTSFTKFHFHLTLCNTNGTFIKELDGQTPQECLDKLNAKIDKYVTLEKTKNNIWESYGF